jgi:hypothetical protein
MTNDNSFGQRIAATWRELIGHLDKLSARAIQEASDDPATDEGSQQ